MSANLIEQWHQAARPTPTEHDFNVQVGCHVEEFLEMLDSVECRIGSLEHGSHDFNVLKDLLTAFSNGLKKNKIRLNIKDREGFLDSLADQVVTAIGCGHCAGMQTSEAIRRVNASNWSKFDENEQPIRDANGKIAKGPNYQPPNLEGLF